MKYKLKLDIFEGPLDLLLYLIKKNDIDIRDIPITQITEQYMEYIEMMKMLDLDIVGDFLIIRAVRESDGFCIALSDEEIMKSRDYIAKEEGLLLCPEGAATAAAYKRALVDGLISQNDTAVLYNCATGLKYPMGAVANSLDKNKPIDYSQFT